MNLSFGLTVDILNYKPMKKAEKTEMFVDNTTLFVIVGFHLDCCLGLCMVSWLLQTNAMVLGLEKELCADGSY